MANQIEFKAGSGISLSANAADKSITISTTDPAPSTSTPLALNRGGTGVTDLTANQIAGLKAADNPSSANPLITASSLTTLIGNPTTVPRVWGIEINENDSNPFSCITATDDLASNVIYSFGERPCLLKNGEVQYYLNPNDFTKKMDGSDADITSGADGDVMIEIPKLAYFITRIGSKTIVKLTDDPNAMALDPRFKTFAYSRNAIGDQNKIYIGAYLGLIIDNKLRSLSGKTNPYIASTHTNIINAAKANGTNYTVLTFYAYTLLQCMYLMKFKSLHSQAALGYAKPELVTSYITGETNNSGMYFGNTTPNNNINRVKFAGLESIYGVPTPTNEYGKQYIIGLAYLYHRHEPGPGFSIYATSHNFTNNLSNYNRIGAYSSVNNNLGNQASGYFSKTMGFSEGGFLANYSADALGSATTYYCSKMISNPASGELHPGAFVGYRTFFEYGFTLSPNASTTRLMYV